VALLGYAGSVQDRHDVVGGLSQHGGDVVGSRRDHVTLPRPDDVGHLGEGLVDDGGNGPTNQVLDQRLARAGVLQQLILRPLDMWRDGVGVGGGHAVER